MKKLTEKRFRELYDEYVRLVYFIVSKYVDEKHERESITDDVFLKFYNNHEAVRNVKTYLATAAKNAAINSLKKTKNIDVSLTDMADEVFVDPSLYSDYRDVLEELKSFLDEVETEVLLSHAVFGETFGDIAERLGRPLQTVYSIYKRAMKKYKEKREYEKETRF